MIRARGLEEFYNILLIYLTIIKTFRKPINLTKFYFSFMKMRLEQIV